MKIKKRVVLLLTFFMFMILIGSSVDAFSIEFDSFKDTVAIELEIPAKYNFTIINDEFANINFSIYPLVNLIVEPEYKFVEAGMTENFILTALPELRREGLFKYTVYIKKTGEPADKAAIILRVLPLEKIMNIDVPEEVAREDKIINFAIENKEKIDLGSMNFTLESDLFNYGNEIKLDSGDSFTDSVNVDLSEKHAGEYNITFKANIEGYDHEQIVTINLQEVSNIETSQEKKWTFFGYTRTITKNNEGNSRKVILVELPLNSLESSFTNYNIPPTSKDKERGLIIARWQREIEPGESFTIEAKTDYTIPVVIIIILALVLIFYFLFVKKRILIRKKVIKLKTKGGEFAVKVILVAKNVGHEIKNVKLSDNLPLNTKLYEKFGTVKPDKKDKHRLVWNFPSLLPGEEVVVSYVIYSKIGMTGVKLPSAALTFKDSKDKLHTVYSSKVIVF